MNLESNLKVHIGNISNYKHNGISWSLADDKPTTKMQFLPSACQKNPPLLYRIHVGNLGISDFSSPNPAFRYNFSCNMFCFSTGMSVSHNGSPETSHVYAYSLMCYLHCYFVYYFSAIIRENLSQNIEILSTKIFQLNVYLFL